MKKFFAVLTAVVVFSFGMTTNINAQEPVEAPAEATEQVTESNSAVETPAGAEAVEDAEDAEQIEVAEQEGMHQTLKTKFIEGGAGFMATVVFCLIFGLALCIERIIYLNLSAINTGKLLKAVDEAWDKGGVKSAMEVCRNTRGPVASIFYQGLSRYEEGVDVVEKTVASYGSVQLGLLEKNLSWISLFIALAPMLGFMGTVIGMIEAFDKIQQAGDISATVVAGGIKVALLTTVLGLIVAIILQIFYNYILSRIDALTNEMEDSSISLLDIVVKHSK
ncbi:MAG: MotA/TolQ/ExbB proton channel family protein [Paludibacteraceae bacterium]|nr:MotA/TolQ/ExbB proton channel family protein [Candidatus Colousia faecequi]MCQ2338295.1 MotA/TolQ/ExbB proton channel family protein [Paludibacteraceae bacterium]